MNRIAPLALLFLAAPAFALDLPRIGSPWSPMGVVGGFLLGIFFGCGGVAAFVLVSEGTTTNKTKRYIELGVAIVSLIIGVGLIVADYSS